MDIKNQEGLEIFLGYRCNIKCSFCYQKDLRKEFTKNIDREKVLKMIEDGVKNGKRFVIFSGGEPTIDNNLPLYIEHAKKLGYEHIRVHTNGFGFQKIQYLKELYDKGLTGVTLSVHGYDKVHDFITKVSGSFEIIKNSLINFEKIKKIDNNFIIDTNTVVCKDNYKNIPKLVKFLSYFSVTRGQIVLTYSLGLFSNKEKKDIIPEYLNIVPFLEKSIDISKLNSKKFVLENIPFCVIKEKYWNSIIENIKINKESILVDKGNVGNTNTNWMQNSKKCIKCKMNSLCRGIPSDYVEIYSDNCLTTIYD